MNRLYNLDYLRGGAAFGIMIYHYLTWTYGAFSSDTFMERIGIYGVAIFYVLSGLTLYYVYHDRMRPTRQELIEFAKKRILRIYPLLFLATILTVIISRQFPDILMVFLNITGLFGYFAWDAYFATGAWSIGNELVFYAFFPFFIILSKSYKPLFALLSISIVVVYLYFAFSVLTVAHDLSEQWRDYVNPLNQVFLFLGGFIIGMLFKNSAISNTQALLILILGLGLFVFYPSEGDSIHLVTGFARIAFTISCFLICLSFYKTNIRLPKVIDTPLTLLGEISYSIYLLHPIVYTFYEYAFSFLSKFVYNFPLEVKIFVSILTTIAVSYVVYEKFEKYFMKLGKAKNASLVKVNTPS